MINLAIRRLDGPLLAAGAPIVATSAHAVDVVWGVHGPARSVQQFATNRRACPTFQDRKW